MKGRQRVGRDLSAAIDMMFPVECLICGGTYDLAAVEVTARYADCSCWNTPCCKHSTDSRYEQQSDGRATGWVGGGATYRLLTREEIERGYRMIETPDGRIYFR